MPGPRRKGLAFLSLRLRPELKTKLQAIATKEDRTMSYIVSKIVEKALMKTGR